MPFKKIISVSIALSHILMISLPSPAFAGEFSVFQKTYIRENGSPDTIEDTFGVLNANTDWTLRVVNGNLEDDEVEKVSNSTMTLNGEEVLQPKQFNQNVNLIESPVNIASFNTVDMRLRSKPGGQLTVSIIGEDNNAPTAQWFAPQANTVFNDTNVFAQLHLTDDISGLNPQSLQILLNGSDVTSSFVPFTQPVPQPVLSATLQANITAVPGANTLIVNVSDMAGLSTSASVSFSVETFSLNPIGDQDVELGTALNLNVTATGGNGPLTFSVEPIPLPANSSFNAVTGLFSFTPQPDQVGSFPLTFEVTDGVLTESETIMVTVFGPPANGMTTLSGRILDTNAFVVDGDEIPIVGVVVSLLESGVSVITDTDGQFELTGIPSGKQVLDLNSLYALPAPDGSGYAGFREKIELIDGVSNIVERPFFLPRIATENLETINPAGPTFVENSTLGISMIVPQSSAENEDGSLFLGDLSISEVPDGLAPASMPNTLKPGLLITIQPVGVTFSTPVPITFPNIDNLTPGSEVDLWSLDPDTGTFMVVGRSKVSTDGSVVETIDGGIRAADWHFILPLLFSAFTDLVNDFNINQSYCLKCTGNSATAVSTGGFSEEHNLVGYRSFGEQRALKLVYNSFSADPRPIVSSAVTISALSAIPPTISSEINVAGIDQGVEVFTNSTGLDEEVDETIRQAIQFDGSNLLTGRYAYEHTIRSNYPQSSISSVQRGNFLIENQTNSPFGNGWTMAGIQKLHFQNDESVVISEGDGSLIWFERALEISQEVMANVPAMSNILGAGKEFPPAPGGFGEGLLPNEFSILGGDKFVTFTKQAVRYPVAMVIMLRALKGIQGFVQI